MHQPAASTHVRVFLFSLLCASAGCALPAEGTEGEPLPDGELQPEDGLLPEGREFKTWVNQTISIKTSCVENAGTHAKVTLRINDLNGTFTDSFNEDQVKCKTFTSFLGAFNMGGVTSITLSHDNTGAAPAWKVDEVRVMGPAPSLPHPIELGCPINTWLGNGNPNSFNALCRPR
jgi:hypothetical protein